jgi:hypothetical protein
MAPEPVPMQRIAVRAISLATLRVVRQSWRNWLPAAAGPLFLPKLVGGVAWAASLDLPARPANWALTLLRLACASSFAVVWQRAVLEDATEAVRWSSPRFGSAELLSCVAVGLCAAVGLVESLPGAGYLGLPALAAAVASTYVSARLAFVLPIVVLVGRISPRRAWRASRWNGWRIVLVGLISCLPGVILQGALVLVPPPTSPSLDYWLPGPLLPFYWLVVSASDTLAWCVLLTLGLTATTLCFLRLQPGAAQRLTRNHS